MGANVSLDKHTNTIGFGCMGITAFYGDPMPQNDATALLQHVYAKGCRHFDTAEIYKTKNAFADDDGVYNESVIAPFLSTVDRESITVATKLCRYMKDVWQQ